MRDRIAWITCASIAVAALASTPVLSQSPVASTEELYEQERWFELRERLRGSNETSPLITGTVASAFNEMATAERLLTEAIRMAPTVAAANEARGKLTMLYLRLGRSSDAGREIDAVLKTEPRSDIQNVRAVFGAYTNRPNFKVTSHDPGTIKCEVENRGVHVPLAVNGKDVTWLLDTGANVTVISDAEATMLGIPLDTGVKLNDLAGGTAAARSAIASPRTSSRARWVTIGVTATWGWTSSVRRQR